MGNNRHNTLVAVCKVFSPTTCVALLGGLGCIWMIGAICFFYGLGRNCVSNAAGQGKASSEGKVAALLGCRRRQLPNPDRALPSAAWDRARELRSSPRGGALLPPSACPALQRIDSRPIACGAGALTGGCRLCGWANGEVPGGGPGLFHSPRERGRRAGQRWPARP
jgi:hypothetical protein